MKSATHILLLLLFLASCVSKKKYAAIEAELSELKEQNQTANETITQIEKVVEEDNQISKEKIAEIKDSAKMNPILVGAPGHYSDGEPDAEDLKLVQATRWSFVTGIGTSWSDIPMYRTPVINDVSKNVILEKSTVIRPNISLGIQYTPFVFSNTEKLSYRDKNGRKKEKEFYTNGAQGISLTAFISPTLFNDVSKVSIASPVDAGFGIGYRHTNFALYATIDFTPVRQPRDYFVSEYWKNDQPYLIEGEIQNSIDISDDKIFFDETMISYGFKFVYTFNIINAFSKVGQESDSEAEDSGD